jgi:hypothetical protein
MKETPTCLAASKKTGRIYFTNEPDHLFSTEPSRNNLPLTNAMIEVVDLKIYGDV